MTKTTFKISVLSAKGMSIKRVIEIIPLDSSTPQIIDECFDAYALADILLGCLPMPTLKLLQHRIDKYVAKYG